MVYVPRSLLSGLKLSQFNDAADQIDSEQGAGLTMPFPEPDWSNPTPTPEPTPQPKPQPFQLPDWSKISLFGGQEQQPAEQPQPQDNGPFGQPFQLPKWESISLLGSSSPEEMPQQPVGQGEAPVSLSGPSAQSGPAPTGNLVDYARQVATKYGVDPDIFVRQIQQESGFDPTAGSPAGAKGIAQFMPGTAAQYGVDVNDPYSSLEGAAHHMRDLLNMFGGDYSKALAGYNAGPGNVQQYGGVPPFEETQRYVRTILGGSNPAPASAPAPQPTAESAAPAASPAAPATEPAADTSSVEPIAFRSNLFGLGGQESGGPSAAASTPAVETPDLSNPIDFGPVAQLTPQPAEDVANQIQAPPQTPQEAPQPIQPGNPVQQIAGAIIGALQGLVKNVVNPPSPEQQASYNQTVEQSSLGAPTEPPPTPDTSGPSITGTGISDTLGQFNRPSPNYLPTLPPAEENVTPPETPQGIGGVMAQGVAIGGPLEPLRQTVGHMFDDPSEAFRRSSELMGEALDNPEDFRGDTPKHRELIDALETVANYYLNQEGTLGFGEFSGGVVKKTLTPVMAALDRAGVTLPPGPLHRAGDFVAGLLRLPTGFGGPRAGVVEEAAPATATDRYYHGTGGDFERPDAAQFDPNGLFGPGYYLTNEPRVAGGVVDKSGRILSEGYATKGVPPPEFINKYEGMLADVQRQLADPNTIDRPYLQMRAQAIQEQLDAFKNAPNVRAVDVPRGLNLLDADAPVPQGLLRGIRDQLPAESRKPFDRYIKDFDTWPKVTGSEVWSSVDYALKQSAPLTGPPPDVNGLFRAAGYDGIKYNGGQRIPLMDEAGRPIEHQAIVVFPESMDKLTNAISGLPGGLVEGKAPSTAGAQLGRIGTQAVQGAVGGGVAASQQPEATPEDIAKGVLYGGAASVARGQLLRRFNPAAASRVLSAVGRQAEEGAAPERGPTVRNRATWASSVDDPRQRYTFHYEIQPLDDLITSHTDTFAPDPRFPAELQPRLRDRAASRDQVNRIAATLEPDALLSETHRLDSGAPIIGQDNIVESGNGRTLALRAARDQFPERWQAYQDALQAHAGEFGLEAADLAGVRDPVLVRVRDTKVDRAKFAAEANQSTVLAMAPFERAMQDASRLSPDFLSNIEVNPNQGISQALLSPANRQAVRSFMEGIPPNERASLMTDRGELNAAGLERMKSALFASVYPGEAGKRLTETFIESLDPAVKNVENALFASLPAMARAEGLIRSGQRATDLSVANDLAKSVDVLARLKQEGVSVGDYLAQSSMFERELTPLQEQLLGHLDSLNRSPRRLRDFIEQYAAGVESEPHPSQAGLFGDVQSASREELLNRAATRTGPAEADTAPIFATAAEHPTPEAAPAPPPSARLEEPGPRTPAPEASAHGVSPLPEPLPPPSETRPTPIRPSPPSGREVQTNLPGTAVAQTRAALERRFNAGRSQSSPAPSRPVPPLKGSVRAADLSDPENRKLGEMYAKPPKAPETTLPFSQRLAGALTDDRASLYQWQKDLLQRVPPGTAPSDLVGDLTRVNPDSVGLQRLDPVMAEVGKSLKADNVDPSILSLYLGHIHNIDIANDFGQRAYDAVIQRGGSAAAAQAAGIKAANGRHFPGGQTLPSIIAAVRSLESDLGPQRAQTVKDAAQRIWDLNQETLLRKAAVGGLDPEKAADLLARYPHYVTTDIVDHLNPEGMTGPGGRSISQREAPIKALSATGTTADRLDPLQSVVMNTVRSERWIARNEAFRTFYEAVQADPTQAAQLLPPGRGSKMQGTREVVGYVDGERKTMVLPKPLADVVEMGGQAGGAASMGILGQALAPLMGLKRAVTAGLTTYNPGFQYGVNPLRDMADFVVRETAQQGGPQTIGRVLKAYAEAIPDVFAGFREGRSTGQATSRYHLAGGGYERVGQSPEDMQRLTKDLLSSGGIRVDSPRKLAEVVGNVLTLGAKPVGERIELIPRVAAAKLAEQRGATPLESMVAGRNATVPFEVGGTWARGVNTIVPFFNATVQGGAQFARSMHDHPVATTASMATLIGTPALIAQYLNRSDPQRKAAYDDVPQYLKDTGIVVMTPWAGSDRRGPLPNYVWFPLGNFGAAAVAANEAVARYTGDIEPRDAKRVVTALLSAYSPLKGQDAGSVISSFLPPGFSQALELSQNRDFFRGRAIATEEADRTATSAAKVAAEGLSHVPGLRDIRPSQVDYLLRDLGGVAGQLVQGGSQMIAPTGEERNRPIQNTPIVGGIIGRVVRDQTGQQLENARQPERMIPSSVDRVIRQAGLRPQDAVQPVGVVARGIPLTRDQQLYAQRRMNAYIGEEFRTVTSSSDFYESPGKREQLVRDAISRARDRALEETLQRIPQEYQDYLKEAEKRRKAS